MSENFICENINVNEAGHLTFAGLDTSNLAAQFQTPVYLMDEERIRQNCRAYTKAFKEHFGGDSRPLYASKANSFKYIYKIMKEEGMGIDVVYFSTAIIKRMRISPLPWSWGLAILS